MKRLSLPALAFAMFAAAGSPAAYGQSEIYDIPPIPSVCDDEVLLSVLSVVIGRMNGIEKWEAKYAKLEADLAQRVSEESTRSNESVIDTIRGLLAEMDKDKAKIAAAKPLLKARYDEIRAARAALANGTAPCDDTAKPKPAIRTGPPANAGPPADAAPPVAPPAADPCDKAAVREEQKQLERYRTQLEGEKRALNERIKSDENARSFSSGEERAAVEARLKEANTRLNAVNKVIDEVEARAAALSRQVSCGPERPKLTLAGGYASAKLPELAFLGRETPGATAPTLGLFESARTVTGSTVDFDFKFGFSYRGTDTTALENEELAIWDAVDAAEVEFNLRFLDATSRAEYGRADLRGDRLVIPGLGGEGDPNRNGFVFNYFNGLNSPEAASVTRDFVSTEVQLGVLEPLTISERLRWVYGYWGAYEAEQHEANFSASVPGFARDIGYVQEIDLDAFKLGATLGFEYDLDDTFTLGFQLRGAVVFADYEGTNKLTFTGFSPQIVSDEGSGTFFDGDINGYLEGEVSEGVGIVIAAGAFYSSGTPVWRTPGGGTRAFIDTDDSSGWYATVGLHLRY